MLWFLASRNFADISSTFQNLTYKTQAPLKGLGLNADQLIVVYLALLANAPG